MPGDKPKSAPSTSEPIVGTQPAYLKNTAPATMAAGMPGQIDALARQLGIGFGQTPKSFYDHLNTVYRPAQTLNYNAPPPKPIVDPKVVDPKKPDPKVDPTKPTDKWTYLGGRNAR